jgi:hypothetical protein
MSNSATPTVVTRDSNNTFAPTGLADLAEPLASSKTDYHTTLPGQLYAPLISDADTGRTFLTQFPDISNDIKGDSKLAIFLNKHGASAARTPADEAAPDFEEMHKIYDKGRPHFDDDAKAADGLMHAGFTAAATFALLKTYTSNKELRDDLAKHGVLVEGEKGLERSPDVRVSQGVGGVGGGYVPYGVYTPTQVEEGSVASEAPSSTPTEEGRAPQETAAGQTEDVASLAAQHATSQQLLLLADQRTLDAQRAEEVQRDMVAKQQKALVEVSAERAGAMQRLEAQAAESERRLAEMAAASDLKTAQAGREAAVAIEAAHRASAELAAKLEQSKAAFDAGVKAQVKIALEMLAADEDNIPASTVAVVPTVKTTVLAATTALSPTSIEALSIMRDTGEMCNVAGEFAEQLVRNSVAQRPACEAVLIEAADGTKATLLTLLTKTGCTLGKEELQAAWTAALQVASLQSLRPDKGTAVLTVYDRAPGTALARAEVAHSNFPMPDFLNVVSRREAPGGGMEQYSEVKWQLLVSGTSSAKSAMKARLIDLAAPGFLTGKLPTADGAQVLWRHYVAVRSMFLNRLAEVYLFALLQGSSVLISLTRLQERLVTALLAAPQLKQAKTEINNEVVVSLDTQPEVNDSLCRLIHVVDAVFVPANILSPYQDWGHLRIVPGESSIASYLKQLRASAVTVFRDQPQREIEIMRAFRQELSRIIQCDHTDQTTVRAVIDRFITGKSPTSENLETALMVDMSAGTAIVKALHNKRGRAETFVANAESPRESKSGAPAADVAAAAESPDAGLGAKLDALISKLTVATAAREEQTSAETYAAAMRERVVKGPLDLVRIVAEGLMPEIVPAASLHAAGWRGDPNECTFCHLMRPAPWARSYRSKQDYKQIHGCDPFDRGTARRIAPDEAMLHSEAYCPTAWKYYNTLAKEGDLSVAWACVPIETAEYARRVATSV